MKNIISTKNSYTTYHESFIKNGEIKACLVDGEFFLARKVLPKGDVAILDFHSGEAYHAYYQPTEEEIDFYKNVFKFFIRNTLYHICV